MNIRHKPLLVTVALLALMGAQVFGLQRGYVCFCEGEEVETIAPSCETDDACGDHEHEDAPAPHAPLTVNHEAHATGASSPQVHPPVLLAVLDFSEIVIALAGLQSPAEIAMSHPPPGGGANPPASLLVAECKVLLV